MVKDTNVLRVILRPTVSAFCYSVAADFRAAGLDEVAIHTNMATSFCMRQRARLAVHIKVPVIFMTLALTWAPVMRGKQRFHRLDQVERARVIARWRSSRLQPLRSLIRFYEALAQFALVSFTASSFHAG